MWAIKYAKPQINQNNKLKYFKKSAKYEFKISSLFISGVLIMKFKMKPVFKQIVFKMDSLFLFNLEPHYIMKFFEKNENRRTLLYFNCPSSQLWMVNDTFSFLFSFFLLFISLFFLHSFSMSFCFSFLFSFLCLFAQSKAKGKKLPLHFAVQLQLCNFFFFFFFFCARDQLSYFAS